MPLYDYECEICGVFTLQRAISKRDEAAECEECGLMASLLISAPALALMNPGVRKAIATNERSQNAPGIRNRHSCGSTCGCGPSKKSATAGTKKESKFKAGKAGDRPWMLGH